MEFNTQRIPTAKATDTVPEALKPAIQVFPKAAVESRLSAELIEAAKVKAEIQEIDAPATHAGQRAMEVTIDSLVVVGLLIAVEPILGFELKGGIVREGGYASIDKAMDHLLPCIENEWNKRKGKKA